MRWSTVVCFLVSCGGVEEDPTLSEERIAQRTAEIVLARLEAERRGESAGASNAADGARGGRPSIDVGHMVGDETRMQVPVDGAPARGAREPLVTIVAFSDFECRFCNRVRPTIDRILREHPDTVRFVFRNHPLPFHPNAHLAAQAAHEAFVQGGDAAFWRAHDLFFDHPQALGRADLEAHARTLGLDLVRFRAALDHRTHAAKIDADAALATRLGAHGTPTFFLNGLVVTGAQPFESFEPVINAESTRAEALIEAGVRRSDVYAVLMDHALPDAPDPDRAAAPAPRREPDPTAIYRVPIGTSVVRGPADALVTLVVFTDFQCPFCARLEPTLRELQTRYGQDLRIVYKNNPLPFHENAREAAAAALEAHAQGGEGAYFRMHELLFQNQRALDRPALERYARSIGLDVDRFRRALDADVHVPAIERDVELARSLGAVATPSSFVNGRNLRGAQPIDAFVGLIDEGLATARARVRAGTARSAVYDEIVRLGATTPQFVVPAAPTPSAPTAPAPERFTIAIPRDAPARGAARPRVTIQIFTDFQCPFCSRVVPTIDRLLAAYPNDVRLVFRNYPLPFHDRAPLAHEAAWEVKEQGGDAAFWRYYHRLFENQATIDRADLERFAREIGGIDMTRFGRALDQHTHAARVRADMDAITRSGARIGTPSFFVGDRLIQGAQPYEVFRDAVDAELRPP